MRRSISRIRLSLILLVLASAAFAAGEGQGAGITITEAGRNAGGKTLYNLKAEGADVIELLKQLFTRAGVGNYELSPEIRQSVTVSGNGLTASDLIDRVANAVTPPLSIQTNGRTVFVNRSSTAVSRAEEIRRRMEMNQRSRTAPGIVPSGLTEAFGTSYRDAAALETPVTLNIPDDRPITLGAALQLLEKQTRVPLRLDASLPSDIKFSGLVTRVPLRTVLQKIAPGTGEESLKIVTMSNQILIAPTDRFNVTYGPGVLSSTQACAKCRQPLLGNWSFCPNCGQPTRRGQLQGNQVPGGRKTGAQRPE